MNMQITGGTTFSQIYQERQNVGGALSGLDGGKSLRLKNGDNLYTHDSNKWHSIHFINRASKHEAAATAIKQAIDNELGPGGGNQIFQQLGLNKKVTVGDLKQINTAVAAHKAAAAADNVDGLLKATTGQVGEVRQRLLDAMAELPDVPANHKATQHQDVDFFRSSRPNPREFDAAALQKLNDEGADGLDAAEAAAAYKAHLAATPTMPAEKFAALMTNEHVSDAVGYFTGENTVGTTAVPRDSAKADPDNMRAAARELRRAVDETLDPAEKAALKERIEFARDLAAVSRDKIGLAGKVPDDNEVQGAMWVKSIAVSYGLFAGHQQTDLIAASGLSNRDASVAGRDLVTALAIHYDTVFGER